MLVPPPYYNPPLHEDDQPPPNYKWNPNFPGTMKPGLTPDNFPLEKVLASDVIDRMVYEEIDMDARTRHIFAPDDDLLEWIAKKGRLIPSDVANEDIEMEPDTQLEGITEEDLDYADDDSKMIAYYSKQGEGSATGSSFDFGGFSESSMDNGAGF